MTRILFVDDEPKVLDGLKRTLHRQRRKWVMFFAAGGEEALAELEKAAFDVVVTDMRMPGIDGAALLEFVQERYPDTIRIVLSGQVDLESALRTIPVAHQFLSKPCEGEYLQEVITRACNLRGLLGDKHIRSVVSGLGALPSQPKVYMALTSAMADPDTSAEEIAHIVEHDIGISTKILQVVNSAYFSLQRDVASVHEAVAYLGFNTVKSLVLTIEAFTPFEGRGAVSPEFLVHEQKHAFLCGVIAQKLVEFEGGPRMAYLAGMLHDVGKLVLASAMPDEFERLCAEDGGAKETQEQTERRICGASHGEIGAYLLGTWGLPLPVVEAVAFHHSPQRIEQVRFDVLSAVHVADALFHELSGPAGSPLAPPQRPLGGYLARLGAADRLGEWRAMAADEIEKAQSADSGDSGTEEDVAATPQGGEA